MDFVVGLYRDDGLAVSKLRERQTELRKKKICKIFKDNGIRITTEANAKCVNFLDVTFNLETGLYKPYMKPNNTPVYVHVESNHPPSIIKNIPKSVSKRLIRQIKKFSMKRPDHSNKSSRKVGTLMS